MPRPPKMRTIRHVPGSMYFKPQGVPLSALSEEVLGLDEIEALRLSDLLGLSLEETGQRMQVSRATAGRILERARRKVATALVTGRALRIKGGPAQMPHDDPSGRQTPRGRGHAHGRVHGRGTGRENGRRRGRGGPPWGS